jgi:RNA polymerase sigma factor (sigma-70 family)
VERAYAARERGVAGSGVRSPDGSVEDRDALWRALARLSERQRVAIVLRFYEDLSERQIADVMKCRPGTVKSLVSRGLETLRNQIEGEDR